MPKTRKTWQEKLADSKGLPKVEKITDKMSKRWGTGTVVIPAPKEVDEIMQKVPQGKLITINQIRAILARKHGATIGCPMTTGIFAWIAANAAEEAAAEGKGNITPYWRTLKSSGELNEKYPGGVEAQAARLREEGHTIEPGKGKKPPKVKDFEKALWGCDMNTFEETISQMPSLLAELMKKPLLNRLDIGKIPPLKGIYVFVENNCPIYVGRSKNIRNRFDQHCRNSSDHNSAPFAFNLAKEKYENRFGSTKGTSRKELSIIPAFSELFDNEKERVSKMKIRMMEIDDSVAQTIFEVYAALKLNTTKYNDFDTH